MRRRCHSPQMRDAARAPHGDNNFSLNPVGKRLFGDAARAPHGDSNQIPAYPTQSNIVMQPVPLTGTKKRETRNSSVSCLPFYISACSLTSLFHIDEEGYAGILCHSPCAAGFRCVLRGRRQLVYILSLYLSYVKFILRHNLSYDKYIQLKTCIKPPPRTENWGGGFVMQGFLDIPLHSDTECPQPLDFPRGRGRTFR